MAAVMRPCDASCQRDDRQRAADGDRVLDQGRRQVAAEGLGQLRPHRGAAERAEHRADGAGDPAEHELAARRGQSRAAERAGDDAGAELHRNLAARRRGQLVADQLAERQHAEHPGRGDVAHEGQRRAGELQPAEVRRPCDRGRRGHGAQAGDDADQQRQDEDRHAKAPGRVWCRDLDAASGPGPSRATRLDARPPRPCHVSPLRTRRCRD